MKAISVAARLRDGEIARAPVAELLRRDLEHVDAGARAIATESSVDPESMTRISSGPSRWTAARTPASQRAPSFTGMTTETVLTSAEQASLELPGLAQWPAGDAHQPAHSARRPAWRISALRSRCQRSSQ